MNEKSSCPVLRGRDGGNTILLLDDLRTAKVREVQITGANLSHARLSKALASRVQREQVPPTNRG